MGMLAVLQRFTFSLLVQSVCIEGALWAGGVFPSPSCISLGRCDGVLDSRIWVEVM